MIHDSIYRTSATATATSHPLPNSLHGTTQYRFHTAILLVLCTPQTCVQFHSELVKYEYGPRVNFTIVHIR